MSKQKSWFPDSLVLIFSIIVLAQLLSYVIPAGQYEREPVPDKPDKQGPVIPGSFHLIEEGREPLPVYHILTAIPRGLADPETAEIIFLVFLVGGVIAVLRGTGAIDAALRVAVQKAGGRAWILIAVCSVMFGLGSFSVGMGEEYVPLIPILVTMSLAMKMDAIVALGMVWIPCGIGWATAAYNPFGVVIAQGIAGLDATSGAGFRWVLLFIFLAVGFQHVYAYARKIWKDPSQSLVADIDYSEGFALPEDIRFTQARMLILTIFVGGIVLFVWGATTHGWYIGELNAVFLGIALLAAIIARMTPNHVSRLFIRGAAEMTSAALLIGFAKTISIVKDDGMIKDTVVHSIAGLLEGTSSHVAALGMMAVQTVCNFFIPSGSGQAFVTMPIMSPLATVTEVPQQCAVLAYQFGDGFTNMIVPTSAILMGVLTLSRIPYARWVRFVTPLLIKLFVVAIAALVFSVQFADFIGFAD